MSNIGRGQTLGGGPPSDDPLPPTWGRPPPPRIGRIGDWNNPPPGRSNAGPPRLPIAQDDDDDDDEANREGESCGISIQNPNARGNLPGGQMVRDILRRAAETSAARATQPPSTRRETSTTFRGSGNTLGSDEVESTFVPDPNAQEDGDEEETVQRNITFWRNGFSIEGGQFYSYADPENEELLSEINTGRAPMSVLNVQPGQPVEVIVSKRTDEDYVTESRPFGGSGNRLGSPVPTAVTTSMPGSFPASSSTPPSHVERPSVTTLFEVDQTQPMTTVQIRLADGTRMPCRMNLSHTIGDIRNFINASRPENLTRTYTIGTTFPNRTLDNNGETIQAAGLANSVVVQRWV